jgi:CheY-like chemotaxis protein
MPEGGTFSLTTTHVGASSLSEKFPLVGATEYLCISASDTGTGMDEATKQRLFEPFFTTKEKGKGTGLGLSVVYGIMQSHHGFIDVESALGKGTTFRMYFPIMPRGEETAAVKELKMEEAPGGNETLLIIEDEEMLRELLRLTLEAKGYKVLTANDGEQGLSLYQKHQHEIALVLTDLGLPKMDGDNIFRKMVKLNPNAKVIIASGYIEPEAKSKLFAAGARAFLQKPFRAIEAMNCIREEIDRRSE